MRSLPRPLALLLAGTATGAVLLTGCGAAADEAAERAVEQAIESETGGDVDIDTDGDGSFNIETEDGTISSDGDGNVEIDTEDGSFSAGTGEVPEAWPSDIPLPDDLTVLSSTELDSSDGRLILVSGTTGTSAADLLDEYRSALSGWTVSGESTSTGGGATIAGAQFDTDGRRVTVQASEVEGETTVNVGHTTLS